MQSLSGYCPTIGHGQYFKVQCLSKLCPCPRYVQIMSSDIYPQQTSFWCWQMEDNFGLGQIMDNFWIYYYTVNMLLTTAFPTATSFPAATTPLSLQPLFLLHSPFLLAPSFLWWSSPRPWWHPPWPWWASPRLWRPSTRPWLSYLGHGDLYDDLK